MKARLSRFGKEKQKASGPAVPDISPMRGQGSKILCRVCPRKNRFLAAFPLLVALAQPAFAGGRALVIGIDGCAAIARTVHGRLLHQGIDVTLAVDPGPVVIREALDDFAAQPNTAPGSITLVYVCGAAQAVETRLFVLAHGFQLGGTVQPETKGLAVSALLNALRDTGGTLYLDLGLQAGGGGAAAIGALRARLPTGVHLALAVAGDAAPLGRLLASGDVDVTQDWTALVPKLASRAQAGPGGLTLEPPAPTASASQQQEAPAVPAKPSSAGPVLPNTASRTSPVAGAATGQATASLAHPGAQAEPRYNPATGPSPARAVGQAPAGSQAEPVPANNRRSMARAAGTASGATAPERSSQARDDVAGEAEGARLPPLRLVTVAPLPTPPFAQPARGSARQAADAARAHHAMPDAAGHGRATDSPAYNKRVAREQAALIRQGIYHGPVDGALDGETLMAVRAFQHKLGDPESGTLNGTEIVRLLNPQ